MLAVLLLLTALIRLSWMGLRPESLTIDRDAYLLLAGKLAEGAGFVGPEGMPTAFRPLLFPLLLAPFLKLMSTSVAVAAVQVSLSLILTWATIRTGQLLGQKADHEPSLTGWLAGLLVAINPLLIVYAGQPMTEILATTLVALIACGMAYVSVGNPPVSRRRIFVMGTLLGLAALTRPALLLLIPWTAACLLFSFPNKASGKSSRTRWLTSATLILAAGMPICAWTLRNAAVMGLPIITTTHGGYTLWLANNPVIQEQEKTTGTSVWPPAAFAQWEADNTARLAGLDEVARDRLQATWGREAIRANPAAFLRGAKLRMQYFWSPVPQSQGEHQLPDAIRWLLTIFYTLLYAGALLGFVTLFSTCRLWGIWALGTILLVMAPHLVYFSNARMRTPIEPLLAILAGFGISAVIQRLRRLGLYPTYGLPWVARP
jgi:hypothetical protein